MSVDIEFTDTEEGLELGEGARQSFEQYRAVSTAAIVSIVLAVFAPFAFIDLWLGVIPAMSILLGIVAQWRIRQSPEEYTGLGLSRVAIVVSIAAWSLGTAWLTYVYVTEVPDGYLRVSYGMLQPVDEGGKNIVLPPTALELNGKKVFIKGFALQGSQQSGIKNFILVRDRGQCCFGGNPSLTDQIQVILAEPLELEWSTHVQRLAGVFRVQPVVENGQLLLVYHLDADYLK